MKLKHTAGKWIVRKTVDNSGDYPVPTYDILSIQDWGPRSIAYADQDPFNANLMAASPDLLEALIKCYKHIKNDMTICGLVVESREAIEKATGLTIKEIMDENNE